MAKANPTELPVEAAQVVREYGPFHDGETVHGVSHDGERVWFATGNKLRALDAERGELTGELSAVCDAGTAFDGTFFYQLGEGQIQKIDPHTGEVLARLATPGPGDNAGLTWAEGKLWLAKYDARRIYQLDPTTGALLKTIESNRFVTGVTWVEGDLWHGTLEEGVSELRRVRVSDGEVLTRLTMPEGAVVTGLEWDGDELFYCGGGASGKVRAVKRPRSR